MTSNLMTPTPSDRLGPPALTWGGRGSSRLRAHLSFMEKGLGPQLLPRRDTAAGDRWEPPPVQPAPRFCQVGVRTRGEPVQRRPGKGAPRDQEREAPGPADAQPRGPCRAPAPEGGVCPLGPGPGPNTPGPPHSWRTVSVPPARGRGEGQRSARRATAEARRGGGAPPRAGVPPWRAARGARSAGRGCGPARIGAPPRPRAPRPPRPGQRAARTWAAGRRRALRQRGRRAPRSSGKCGGAPRARRRAGRTCGRPARSGLRQRRPRRQEVLRRPRAPLTWTFSGLAQHRPHRGAGRAGEAPRAG